jgi:hypothetical protein
MVNKKNKFNHSPKLSSNIMGVICGRTGAGKTYLLFKMLTTPGILDYDNLIILTSTPEQTYFQLLKHGFDNHLSKQTIQKCFEFYESSDENLDIHDLCCESKQHEQHPSNIKCVLTDDPKIIEDPTKLKSNKNMIIFDDILTMRDQSIPQMMFTKGRHNNCACFYLSQSFYDIDKLIRKNANTFILFETNDRSLKELTKDIIVDDEKEFKQYAKRTWANRYGYVVINQDSSGSNDRYFNSI